MANIQSEFGTTCIAARVVGGTVALDGGGNLVDSGDFCRGDDDACGGGGGSWDNDSNTDRDGTTEEECRGRPSTPPIFDDEATVEAAVCIIGGADDRRSIAEE